MFLFYTLRQNIKDIENELDKNRREHEQFNQDINANKVITLSQNYVDLAFYSLLFCQNLWAL